MLIKLIQIYAVIILGYIALSVVAEVLSLFADAAENIGECIRDAARWAKGLPCRMGMARQRRKAKREADGVRRWSGAEGPGDGHANAVGAN